MGEGPEKEKLQRLVARLNLAEQVTFRPFGTKEEVYRLIGQADALVLPSRYDGWGVVVNEALLYGVPVVCTDRCGASDLVRSNWRGFVVKSGSVSELAAALRVLIDCGKRSAELTARIRAWSKRIYGESAADYLVAVLNHVYDNGPRPIPPWYDD
jgi:glycosyltransferase involved in cell wall biosynthesis